MQQEINRPPHSVNISGKAIAKYAFLPGVLPRLGRLASHVSEFMFMFTQIFGMMGLVDKNHPCLDPANIGKYSFSSILLYAASNLRFTREGIPQIIMFSAIVLSLLLLVGMLVIGAGSFMFAAGSAHAQFFSTPSFSSPEGTSYTVEGDWAMIFLSRIFGMEEFFGTCTTHGACNVGGNPWFIGLLTGMIKHYSMAMLVVAAFMVLYLMVITLTEAARTGKPFGTRFDSIWAPIRLALAIGLLIPITSQGYNGAQMFVLQSAKWGSNLATNAWYAGLEKFSSDGADFFAASMSDPGYRFVRDMFMVNLCIEALKFQQKENRATIDIGTVKYRASMNGDSLVFSFGPDAAPDFCGEVKVMKKMSTNVRPPGMTNESWPEYTTNQYQGIAREFLPVRGRYDEVANSAALAVASATPAGIGLISPVAGLAKALVGEHFSGEAEAPPIMLGFIKEIIQQMYVKTGDDKKESVQEVATQIWNDNSAAPILGLIVGSSDEMQSVVVGDTVQGPGWIQSYWGHLGRRVAIGSQFFQDNAASPYNNTKYREKVTDYNQWLVSRLKEDATKGWTTAGVFYLRISSAMSVISKVISGSPRVTLMPSNFSKPFATPDHPRANTEQMMNYCSGVAAAFRRIAAYLWNGDQVCTKAKLSETINGLLQSGRDWFEQAPEKNANYYAIVGGDKYRRYLDMGESNSSINMHVNIVADFVMGYLDELFQKVNLSGNGNKLHPLGAVVNWGFNMMTVGVTLLGVAIILPGGLGDIAMSLGQLLVIPGFILAFWIPMMPFMYFTFAVVEWMVSVLEAVIGMPLWALTLISLDGDGLGKGMDGVKAIFEIILRPTIIVMALLVSMIVFTAAVAFFSDAITLYAQARNEEQATLTVTFGIIFIYMFSIYSLANSCFKLIDAIPENFGRWGGLPSGFNSSIKTGISEIGAVVVGGLAMKQVMGAYSSKVKDSKAKMAAAAAKK